MGCILRIIATSKEESFKIANRIKQKYYSIQCIDRGVYSGHFEIKYLVSDYDLDEYEMQFIDAIEWLKINMHSCEVIHNQKNIINAFLDFGIKNRGMDFPAQYISIDPQLVFLASQFNFGITISLYMTNH